MSKKPPSTPADLPSSLTLIVGSKNIIFATDVDSDSKLTPYLKESRNRHVGRAFAVVFPSTTEEVAKIVATCRFHKIPIIPQGGNTGRCFGTQTDDEKAILINLKHLNRIREFDAENMTITVEAGAILQDIQTFVRERGLFFPLSLGAEGSCYIGGNLATNAGGINVLRYGNTRDLTLGIEAVIANGNVLNNLSGLRKDNTGYDLKNLLIGSEGTLAIITAATLKLFPSESNTSHGFFAIASVDDAVTSLRNIQAQFSDKVSTFELIPNVAIKLMEKHSAQRCPIDNHHPWYVWYKIADNNPQQPLLDDNVSCLQRLMEDNVIIDAAVSQNESTKKYFEKIRETIVAVQKHADIAVKNDISVPISAFATLIEKGNEAIENICPGAIPYPFGHVGDGNLHYNIMRPIDMSDDEFITTYYKPLQAAVLDIVDGLDGSFAAEHGIGSMKVDLMLRYKDPIALDMMRRIKHSFDPFNLMNPQKVIPQRNKQSD